MGWSKRFWRSVSPSKESRRSQSADGRDREEMFQERATYTTHATGEDGMENGGAAYAKTGSEEEDQGKEQTDHQEGRQDRKPKQGLYMDEDENNDKANTKGYSDNKHYRGQSVRTEDRVHDTDAEEIMAFITQAERATHEELIEHVEEANFSEKTKEVVMDRRVDGATWMMLWNMDSAKTFITKELGVDIIQEAKYRGHIQKARKSGDSKDKLRLTDKEAPGLEEPKNTLSYTYTEWLEYKEKAMTWIESNDEDWVNRVDEALEQRDEEGWRFWKSMTKMQQLIDKTWGLKLAKSTLMQSIMGRNDPNRIKRYRPGTKTLSGIRIAKMMSQAATVRTNARMTAATNRKNETKTVGKAEEVAEAMKEFETMKQEYEHQAGSKMSDSEETELLNKIINKLEKDSKYLGDLLIPLSTVRYNGMTKGDTAHETRKVIYRFIEGLPDEKKNKKKKDDEAVNNIERDNDEFRRKLDLLTETLNNIETPDNNRIKGEVCPVVTGPKSRDNHEWGSPIMSLPGPGGRPRGLCLSMRERGRCNKPGCPYDHTVKGEKVCEMQDYEKYGFCSNWYECKCQHPYDERKYGPWETSLAKYRELASKGMTPDTANRGRRF